MATTIERLLNVLNRARDNSRPAPPRHRSRPAHKLAHRLDDQTVSRLLAEYQRGSSVQALVRRYKISKTSVLALLHAHDIPIQFRGRPDEATLHRAIELYEGGLSLLRVSEALSIPDETLRRHLHARGVTIRRRGRARRSTQTG